MRPITRNLPGGLLLLGTDGGIIEAPLFLREWLGDDVTSIFDAFNPERVPHLTLRRVVAGGNGRMEFHVELVGESAVSHCLRYWDLTPTDADIATFYLVDDTSIAESHYWQEQRVRRGLTEDVRSLLASELRPAISALTALADAAKNASLREDAIERYIAVATQLADAVRAIDETLQEKHLIDAEIPFRVVDLPSVLSSASDERTVIECRVQDMPRDVFISSAVVEHVLMPVLHNALEARPKDGWIHVEASRLNDGKICIEVQDLGRGMTKHELTRAQDPFFTTKRGHAGMGLAGAAEVLDHLRGYWNFSSARRRGTKVRICVPTLESGDVLGPRGRT